jgi:hypothetical protein
MAYQGMARGTVLSVTLGNLYVARMPTSVFTDPKCHYMNLTPELWSDWNNLSCLMEEWCLFMLVNNASNEGPVMAAEVEAQEIFAAKAEAHRTPRKHKYSGIEAPVFEESTYKRQLKAQFPDTDNPFQLDSEGTFEILQNMDKGLDRELVPRSS